MPSKDDVKRLLLPILVAASLTLGGTTLLVGSNFALKTSLRDLTMAQHDLEDALTKVSKSNDEERDLNQDLKTYQQLVQRGVVGPERRLDWIDSISNIKARRRLFEITYSLDAQRPADYPGLLPSSAEASVLVSRLKLNMQLLHEGDLLIFLDDFFDAVQTAASLRSCVVTRNDRDGSVRSGPRLQAECIVDLLTIREERKHDGKT